MLAITHNLMCILCNILSYPCPSFQIILVLKLNFQFEVDLELQFANVFFLDYELLNLILQKKNQKNKKKCQCKDQNLMF